VLRALLTIVLTLTFVVAGAASAQAEEWEIEDEPLSSLEIGGESLTSSGGAFELTVPALSLTIKCSSESGSGEIIAGGSTSKASLQLSGCVVSKAEKACSVKSPGKSSGVLAATTTTKSLVKEVSKVSKFYDEVVPVMTIEISGAECSFPSKLEMSGATAAEVPKPEEEAAERVRKFSKTSVEQSGVSGLKLGANQAFLIGEDKEALSGAHKKEAMGITDVVTDPAQLIFLGLERKTITLENTAPVLVEYTTVIVEAGAFFLNQGCTGRTFSNTELCGFGVECQVFPSGGTMLIEWNVLELSSEELISDGERKVPLICGIA
jgi:hypothetical protein